MRRPPLLLMITPATGMLRRYEGRECTHRAKLTEPLSRELLAHIYNFMLHPDHVFNYEPDSPRVA